MNIIQHNLVFTSPLKQRSVTTRLVAHHSASGTNLTVEDIHAEHLAKGWAGIGYHFVIYYDGSVHQGRPHWTIGAHAYQDAQHEANSNGIGICLVGDFTSDVPSPAQISSLVELVHYLQGLYKTDFPLIGHRDVMPTECPGNSFPMAEVQNYIKGGVPVADDWKTKIMAKAKEVGLVTEDHDPDAPTPIWMTLVIALELKGVSVE